MAVFDNCHKPPGWGKPAVDLTGCSKWHCAPRPPPNSLSALGDGSPLLPSGRDS